jgi:hypothetical protein
MSEMRTNKLGFEIETCSRCGGSGEYSYCQSYGTRCFKCAGTKVTLTTRGKAAAVFLRKLRTKTAGEVQFGEAVRIEGVPGFSATTWFKVEAIFTSLLPCKSRQPNGEWKEYHHYCLEGTTKKGEKTGLHAFPESEVYIIPATKEIAAAQLAEAMTFQASLTQAGTVRKTRAKKEAA